MISIRNLIFAFVLAKLCGVAVAFLSLGSDADRKHLSLVADATSFIVLITLISATAKRSPLEFLRNQPYGGVWRGRWWYWVLAVIPIGFFIRFGSEGIVLLAMGIYDPELPYKEFSEALAMPKYNMSTAQSWLLLLTFFALGAAEEEFTYRKILMTEISRSIGLPLGLLVTSLIFGLMHFNPTAFFAGASFAFLYILSGRLMVPLVAHISANMFYPILDWTGFQFDYEGYIIFSYVFAIVFVSVLILSVVAIRRKWLRDGGV